MSNSTLSCKLEVASIGSEKYSLTFNVSNPGAQPVTVEYFKPYIDFDLKAYAADGEVLLTQPAYDTEVEPVRVTIAPGETVRIIPPIHLQFDPDIAPSGGDVATLWTLCHAPTSVRLQAIIRLTGATVAPCEVHFDPVV